VVNETSPQDEHGGDPDAIAAHIRHEPDEARFVVVVEGAEAELVYRLDGQVMTILHTGVPPRIGGRGLAGELVRTALEHARAAGWKVRPVCAYSSAWMDKHPGYEDLRA
jgi:predicted GNAT family acetyltransferase